MPHRSAWWSVWPLGSNYSYTFVPSQIAQNTRARLCCDGWKRRLGPWHCRLIYHSRLQHPLTIFRSGRTSNRSWSQHTGTDMWPPSCWSWLDHPFHLRFEMEFECVLNMWIFVLTLICTSADCLSSFDGLVSTSNHLLTEEHLVWVKTSQPIWWTAELRGFPDICWRVPTRERGVGQSCLLYRNSVESSPPYYVLCLLLLKPTEV